jgi:predicted dehydrogenase
MKQVIRRGLKEIIVDETPDPIALAHHVVVRPMYSLISSGTETASIHQEGVLKEVAENPSHLRKILAIMETMGPIPTLREVHAKFSEYAVLGYSGAGIVAEKHPTVTDLEIGERVAYGGEGTGHAESILTGRKLVARIPDAVPFEQACFATLGSIAMNAVRTSDIGLGDVVAVIGLGLVGQLTVQLAKVQGAVVVAIDLRPERAELAKKLGADHTVSGSAVLESILAITNGRGADRVIVCAASKSPAPAQLALQLCRDRGRLIIVGAVGMEFPWNDMYLKEVQLFMSRAYGPGSYDPEYEKHGRDYPIAYVRWTENRNMEEFLRLLETRRIDVDPLVTHRYALQEAPQAYQTILAPNSTSLAVLLRYPSADVSPAVYAAVRRVDNTAAPAAKPGNIQLALAGAGNLAKWSHLPNLKKNPHASLRAVHSSAGFRGKSYARRFGANYCCSDYQEILNDKAVDAVVIVSRNQYHAAQAVAALRAGKHVFVEKPMALTEEECRELRQAVKESGKHLTVGFNRRFAPYYIEQKKVLDRRSGPAVVGCRVNSPGISGSYWMADPAIGGAILGEACHFVDLMYWLLGSEPVSVSAYTLPTGKKDPVGENNMVAAFHFADGSVGSLNYSTIGSKTSGGERVEVFAEGIGAVTEDFKQLSIRGKMRVNRSKWFADKGYREQMDDFIDAIRKGVHPQIGVEDGVRATITCLRMLESARTLAPCAIDLGS